MLLLSLLAYYVENTEKSIVAVAIYYIYCLRSLLFPWTERSKASKVLALQRERKKKKTV